MSRRMLPLISTLSLLFSVAGPGYASATSQDAATAEVLVRPDPKAQFAEASFEASAGVRFEGAPQGIFLIRLDDAPLATYRGGVAGLQPTMPTAAGERKLDVSAPQSVAYVDYLRANQATFIARMEKALRRAVDVRFTYTNSNNGMAVWLTVDEAAQVLNLEGVSFVQADQERELQTDTGPGWIGAPDIWGGTDCSQPGSCGEGMIVGVIDTGINPGNPSFADIGGDGYDHSNPFGAGNYVGVCDAAETGSSEIKPFDATFPCNDKLIGAWGYHSVDTANGAASPLDYDGHGSHTASTAAGNFVEATIGGGARAPETIDISGVAPHANIIAYAGCCTLSALAASIDQAISDGVDVLNYSIGATVVSDVWNDFDTVGFLNAREAGIFVATSAGNGGPGPATIGAPADAPWLTAVAASTHSRTWANDVAFSGGGGSLATIDGNGFTDGYGPAPVVYAGDFGDALCLTPFPAGTWTSGEIVICDRGQIARTLKGANAAAGGAGGLILANAASNGFSINADAHVIPASHLTFPDGVALKAWVADGSGHIGTISAGTYVRDPSRGDIMASFTSRGPNRAIGIVSPSVAAPGVDILAAYGQNDAIVWDFSSGTSMAGPHVAGTGTLLMQEHPLWTPAEIQSALMLTANTGMLDSDGTTPAGPFDMGNGGIVLAAANRAGLIMGESHIDYLAADPSVGGDPKSLNLPSLADSACGLECSWTRTVTATTGSTWTAAAAASGGIDLAVSPTVFTLAAGETQVLTVTADAGDVPGGAWAFGDVTLQAPGLPDSHLPVAVQSWATADTAAPIDGAGLWGIDVLSSSLTLLWDAATDDRAVAGYGIYRDGRHLADVAGDVTAYDVTGLTPDEEHGFTVKAGDAQGNRSAGLTLDVFTAVDFADDEFSIFEDDIEWLSSAGITRGCNPPTNDQYCPEDSLTRGQMAAMLSRAFDLPASSENFFTDDDDSVFHNDINAVAAAGITLGCDPPANDGYCPDDQVTRGEMAAMLDRALVLPAPAIDFFTDDDGNIFEGAINRLAAANITHGCNPAANDNYCPHDRLTRGQMAAFFRRALS